MRQGGWRKNDWKGKVLVVLVFGVPSDMTRIEFKRKCDEVGLYCFAIGKVEREGEHFRVTLNPKASKEWQRIETEKVSAWVRRLGWRVCIANGLANLRRSPRVNGGKGRMETVSSPNVMGDKSSGLQQTNKDKAGNRRKTQTRDNRSSNDGEGTIDKSRVDRDTKKKMRIGSWNVCGFATDQRKRLEIAEQVSKRDLDIVGIQESWEKEGGEIGCKVEEYAWIGKKRKGQNNKNRGAGGVGFLVKEYLCDIIEVISDTKFDESIWLRVPGERGAKDFFLGNIYMPPESKSTVKEIQRKFGEVAADVQKYKRRGEVVLVGDFNSRIGKASNPNENIGQYGEVTKNKNGAEMLKFLQNNEMKTLNDRVKKSGPEWTRQCIQKGESSILDFIVVENGSSKETKVHVCAADVGTTDHCLIWTESQQTRVIKNRRGRKLYRWRTDKLEVKEKQQEFQNEMSKNAEKFSELLERIGTTENDVERDSAGARIIEGWEQLVKTTASKVIGKKLIICNRAVKWWDEEVKEAIKVRREIHARYSSSKTTAGWEEYAIARKKVREMVEKKKKGIWKDVVNKTNEDFDGGMKQMWVGIKGILGKQAGEADTGIATLRAQNGKMVSSSKGKREVLVEHYRKLGTPTTNENFDAEFEKELNAWAEANVDASEREDSGSEGLQREFTREEVKKCVAKLNNRKAAGADQIVNEFMKYGGEGMLTMMVMLYNWIWKNEYAPKRWREGVVVNLFKKGDKADPGNYRGITLLSTVGKTFCKILNDRMGTMMEKEGKVSEGQAGFRPNRSCVDHVYTLGKIIQGRKDAGLTTYCFFLDVQKAYDTVWRNGLWKKLWEIGIRGKMWRMMKSMTECARSAVMLDGEISNYVDILQGVAQGCTLSPNLFKVYINDMIVAVEAAKQGVPVGDDTVSGLMFADDFVCISETPEGLQKQIGKALEYTRKWRVTANVKKCAVVVCNEDKENPITFKWKWGKDELPIVDQYTYLGVEISKDCSWDTHIAKVIGKGKAHVGKMDAILTDSHLDTRIKRCILMNVIVPKLEYAGEVWEGNAKLVKQLETVQMTAAKKVLGCSSTTSNTVLRAELGMYPLKTNRDVRKLKWQYKVRNMPKHRLPAIADRAVWEKVTKGRAGVRWNSVVEKVWQDIGGNPEEILSIEKFGGFKTEVNERIEIRERLALRNKVNEEEHLELYGGLKEGIGMKRYLHGPMDYAKSLKLRFRVGDLDLPERRNRYTSSREEEEEGAQRCPCGKAKESRTHIVGECEMYKEERDVLEEEMKAIDGCDMEEFGTLDSSEKTIAILGDRWWPQTAKQVGDKISKKFLCNIWTKRNEHPNVGGVSLRSRNGAPSRKGCVVNGQMTKASNK